MILAERITRSLSHFVPQLALPKHFDTSRAETIVGSGAPRVSTYWDRMLEWLLASNWSAALPEQRERAQPLRGAMVAWPTPICVKGSRSPRRRALRARSDRLLGILELIAWTEVHTGRSCLTSAFGWTTSAPSRALRRLRREEAYANR